MARTRFTQADVTRALKAAVAAGLTVRGYEIDPEGKVVVHTAAEADNSPDAALKVWERTHGAR